MEDPELTTIEEHLLWCDECLDRAEALDSPTGMDRDHAKLRRSSE